MRLAEEQGKFQALEYDAGSFPPESNLITNPSLERLPYEIPRIRPKQVTVYPSHGARIVDPRVETPDGQRVNVLLEGDSYVYRYRVEVTEDGSGVSCGMAINDQHGDAVGVNACSHHDEVIEKVAKGSTLQAVFLFQCRLRPGVYFLNAGVTSSTDGIVMPFAHRIVNGLAVVIRSAHEGFQVASPHITQTVESLPSETDLFQPGTAGCSRVVVAANSRPNEYSRW
jgi:hypothetical protein